MQFIKNWSTKTNLYLIYLRIQYKAKRQIGTNRLFTFLLTLSQKAKPLRTRNWLNITLGVARVNSFFATFFFFFFVLWINNGIWKNGTYFVPLELQLIRPIIFRFNTVRSEFVFRYNTHRRDEIWFSAVRFTLKTIVLETVREYCIFRTPRVTIVFRAQNVGVNDEFCGFHFVVKSHSRCVVNRLHGRAHVNRRNGSVRSPYL